MEMLFKRELSRLVWQMSFRLPYTNITHIHVSVNVVGKVILGGCYTHNVGYAINGLYPNNIRTFNDIIETINLKSDVIFQL